MVAAQVARRSRPAGGSCRARAGRAGRAGCRPRRAARRRRAPRRGRAGCPGRSRSGRRCGGGRAAATAATRGPPARAAAPRPASTKTIVGRAPARWRRQRLGERGRRSGARPRSRTGVGALTEEGRSLRRDRAERLEPELEGRRRAASAWSSSRTRRPERLRGRRLAAGAGTARDHTIARRPPPGGHPAIRAKRKPRPRASIRPSPAASTEPPSVDWPIR